VSLLNSRRKLLPGGNRLARRHRPSRFLGGREQVSICEALERLLNKGAVVVGEATIGLAEIDLIYLQLQLVLSSVETARGRGCDGSTIISPRRHGGHGEKHTEKDGEKEPCSRALSPCAPPCLRGEEASPPPHPPGEPDHSVRPHGKGLAQLILTLVKLLHELMQRQALRRMEAGSLSPEQIEQLGVALMKQFQEIERLRSEFGLEAEDLNLDLGPIGKLF
jgi:hypothetical protein